MGIHTARHPEYRDMESEWRKYKLAYDGDFVYKNTYLKRLSRREGDQDFYNRRDLTYVPRYAGAIIDETVQAITQRMDIERSGGPKTYQDTIDGKNGGVDYFNTSMTQFMCDDVLLPFAIFGRAGVLVDNHSSIDFTDTNDKTVHPYLKVYDPLQIRSWSISNVDDGFDSILLEEQIDQYDFNLVTGTKTQYRKYTRKEEGILVQVYTHGDGKQYGEMGRTQVKEDESQRVLLDIPRIPFTLLKMRHGLMRDIADVQTAIMNIESTDIQYCLFSNYPFLARYYDEETFNPHLKNTAQVDSSGNQMPRYREETAGSLHGKNIPEGQRMEYIAPPSDTLEVSMKKTDKMKELIRSIRNMNLKSLNSNQRDSAATKQEDKSTMEAGLAYMAGKMHAAELEIVEHWNMFDTSGSKVTIIYPTKFSLMSVQDTIKAGDDLLVLSNKVSSPTFKRQMQMKVVKKFITDPEVAKKIQGELERTQTAFLTPKEINQFIAEGAMTKVLGLHLATGLSIPECEKEIEKAEEEKTDFLEMTLKLQQSFKSEEEDDNLAARSNDLKDLDPDASKKEKEGKQQRGEGKETE